MTFWSAIFNETREGLTGYIFLALFVILVLARLLALPERRLLKGTVWLFGLHLAMVPVAAGFRYFGSDLYREIRLVSRILSAMCVVQMAVFLVFVMFLPRVKVQTSRILRDVVIMVFSIIAIFSLASRAGMNLSGLVATSAVLTAVIGFALKDTLGNVIGGLSLQTDKSIKIGDWIKVGEVVGRVVEIRWRYTAMETRNWETLIVPNSVLTTEKVMVLGRRTGQPLQWRRWCYFNVDYRYTPSEVIRTVVEALAQPIQNVAPEPRPNCVLMDLFESYGRYAIRYWLTDLAVDDPTDTVVRTRIYFALKRAGIPLSLPAHAIFMTEESKERKEELLKADHDKRANALSRVEIFRPLSDEDRHFLAESLHHAPFAAGEILTQQGTEAHWLYLIVKGEVIVRVAAEGGLEKEVARLSAGDFFGEMSLMTGEPRSATVVAATPVECYRLDKAAFQEIIRNKPAIADPVAEILARRRVELVAVRENLDQEARRKRVAADKMDLARRIRDFFGLAEEHGHKPRS
jgi:small-conductance mechanosensitive channel/CRP-like cAMP-binding protein